MLTNIQDLQVSVIYEVHGENACISLNTRQIVQKQKNDPSTDWTVRGITLIVNFSFQPVSLPLVKCIFCSFPNTWDNGKNTFSSVFFLWCFYDYYVPISTKNDRNDESLRNSLSHNIAKDTSPLKDTPPF